MSQKYEEVDILVGNTKFKNFTISVQPRQYQSNKEEAEFHTNRSKSLKSGVETIDYSGSEGEEKESAHLKPYTSLNLGSIVKHHHCLKLLTHRRIVFMGDSLMRGMYKDMIAFCTADMLVRESDLKSKGEDNYRGDRLVMGGSLSSNGMHNGKTYREWRTHTSGRSNIVTSFHYITRCYNEYVASVIDFYSSSQDHCPDYLVMMSSIWDLSRYSSASAMPDYEENLANLFEHVTKELPNTVLIWCISPPVAGFVRGGFSSGQLCNTLRYDMIEGKRCAYKIAEHFPVQIVDLHHGIQPFDYLRKTDGIHYNNKATRMFTKQILYQMYITSDIESQVDSSLIQLASLEPVYIQPEVNGQERTHLTGDKSREMAQLVERKVVGMRPGDIVQYVRCERKRCDSPPRKRGRRY